MRQTFFLFFFLFCSLVAFHSAAQRALRAQRFLEKGDLEKVVKHIGKGISKQADDPANYFMLAQYYAHEEWSYSVVDSAQLYLGLAKSTYDSIPENKLKRYNRRGMDSLQMASLQLKIDSLAFQKATDLNTEEAYNHFIDNYSAAKQLEEAISLRNQVAYDDAIAKNTTYAVSDFFKKYPDAPQAQKARNVFETLYYEKKTQNEALNEYKEYLKERPHTDFAEEAAFKLLNLISAGADEASYQKFSKEYKQFEAAKIAQLVIDGLQFEENEPELLTHKKDSLFYFYDLEKESLLPFQFENVISDSCFYLKKPFILSKLKDSTYAYLKNGEKLADLNSQSIAYLGSGYFKISDSAQGHHLIHSSLNDTLTQKSLDFQALDEFHFAKKMEDGWHLISILGEPILNQAMDSIWKEEDVFFFLKGDDMAVSSAADFKKIAKNDLKSLSFLYDEYEWIDNHLLKLFSKDYETIIDHQAQLVYPLEKAKFEFYDDFWLKETEGKFNVLDKNKQRLFEGDFENYQYKSGILALQKGNLWSVFMDGLKGFPEFTYDSIRIFNTWLTYAEKDSSKFLLFQSGKKIRLLEKQAFRILKNYNIAFLDGADQIRFVEIVNDKGYFELYNGFGRKIKEGEKLDINILTPKFIQIHQDKKKQLLDSAGVEIEIKDVEAFGAYQNGLIPILQNKKFGALIVDNLKLIPAHSQSKLEVFLKDSLFVFREDNLWGISDASANILLEADFESIDFFNDSTAIVQEAGEIEILNIYQNEYLHENIDSWKKVEFEETAYFIIRKQAGYGLINQLGKEIIPFIFNELTAYESKGKLYWLAERRLSEINYIVIAYFDQDGNVLFKEGLNFDDYLETACD